MEAIKHTLGSLASEGTALERLRDEGVSSLFEDSGWIAEKLAATCDQPRDHCRVSLSHT